MLKEIFAFNRNGLREIRGREKNYIRTSIQHHILFGSLLRMSFITIYSFTTKKIINHY